MLQRIFVKIDDCPLWSKQTLYHIRQEQLAEEKKLNFDSLEDILCKEKGNQHEQISFNKERIEKALPSELLRRDKRYIEQYIIKAIDYYKSVELERGDDNDLDL